MADDPKATAVIAARTKAATELVSARKMEAEAETRLAKAEADAKAPVNTKFTPRPQVFHRAKMTYRDTPPNTPYLKVSTGRRLALACWMTDAQEPAHARVAVNHIWARHFGERLSPRCSTLVLRTARPENLELLDWLAVELMASGWRHEASA